MDGVRLAEHVVRRAHDLLVHACGPHSKGLSEMAEETSAVATCGRTEKSSQRAGSKDMSAGTTPRAHDRKLNWLLGDLSPLTGQTRNTPCIESWAMPGFSRTHTPVRNMAR